MTWLNSYSREPEFNYFMLWYVYRVLICEYMLKDMWLQMKFVEKVSGEVKIDASKGGGGYKLKGNDYTIFSPSNS